LTGAPYNTTHWERPAFDKLFFDALGDTDPAGSKDKWASLQKQLYDEGGFLIWGTTAWLDGLSPKVQGVVPSAAQSLGNFYFDQWWLS
jgi:peptide/nickel transport system substrate-binding protein